MIKKSNYGKAAHTQVGWSGQYNETNTRQVSEINISTK